MVMMGQRTEVTVSRIEDGWRLGAERRSGGWATATETLSPAARTHGESEYRSYTLLQGMVMVTVHHPVVFKCIWMEKYQ